MLQDRSKLLTFMIATNRLDELYYNIAKQIGMRENEFVLFYALSDGAKHTQRSICEAWQMPRTTLNSVTKKLVKSGYIELVPTGHKEKELRLTDVGKSYLDKNFSSIFKAEQKAFDLSIGPNVDDIINAITEFNRYFSDALQQELL